MVLFLFNTVIYVFLLLGLCILIVRLPWLRFFRAFSSVVRQMPGYNSPRRDTVRTLPKIFFVLCIVCFVSFCVLFVCKCLLYFCHRVTTQLHLTNISYVISYRTVSYRIISYHIISYTIYHITSYHITSHHFTSHHITSHHIWFRTGTSKVKVSRNRPRWP